jgi:chemotaxis signal transduction protein
MNSEIFQALQPLTSPSLSPPPDPSIRDERSAGPKCERFVAFFLGEKLFGIQADKVAEVAQPQHVTSLPNAGPGLMGITALRGEVIAVLDLAHLLGEVSAPTAAKPKLVVLHGSHPETQFSFPVDRMHEVVSLTANQIEAGGSSSQIAGLAAVNGRVLYILDPSSLAQFLTVT